ncbi:GNAT family N-acetyltransferase [Rhizobium sp. L1K21]|uniref:GNAT family N-acetyltransferase n=1 Tax=Rhizobium sp. L1K21 TaxID=2954933 RepID=UPI00209274C4|nr:GNAT family N-acetyltransferase [Rhizobium sp. L1K21]MCO6187615.1 GNAT family N-acetyltransferase [Rhizobium sp. L1K21]
MSADSSISSSRAKRRPLAEIVVEQISSIILNGELRPGDKLNEAEIAERLKVSRGPVREATRQLKEAGLLETHAYRGAFVRKLDQREISDIYALREILECTAALAAVRLASPDDFGAIENALRDTETAALSNARARMIEADVAFHTALCHAGHNGRITETFSKLATELRLVHLMMSPNPDQLKAAALDHRTIMEALRNRTPDRLIAALRSHITGERDLVLQYLGPHGDTANTASPAASISQEMPLASRFIGKVSVRKHTSEDFPLLARMNRELADDEGHRNPMNVSEMEERFRKFVGHEGWSVDLFLLDDEIVGYATHKRETDPSNPRRQRIFLRQFFIVRHYRRDGMGQAAFNALASARFKAGDHLMLEAIENNPGGRVFWQRLGFTPYSAILEYTIP